MVQAGTRHLRVRRADLRLAVLVGQLRPKRSRRRSIFIAVTLFASYLVLRFSLDQIIRLLAVMWSLSAVLNLGFVLAFPEFGSRRRLDRRLSPEERPRLHAALGLPTLIIAGGPTARPATSSTPRRHPARSAAGVAIEDHAGGRPGPHGADGRSTTSSGAARPSGARC